MEQHIKNEQLKLLFAGLPSALLTTVLLVALTVAVAELIGVADTLLASTGILVVTALRFVLWIAYRRSEQRENVAWWHLFFVGCVAAGAAWGSAGVLMFPSGDVAAQAFLSFLIAGVSAGAVSLLSVGRWHLIGFLIPCVLPVAVRLYLEPGNYSHVMGLMGMLYTVVIIGSGLRLHRQVRDNIVLRLEASERQLAQQRSERALAIANRQLRDFFNAADHVAIIAMNAQGKITMVNRGAEQMLEYAEHELAGQRTLEPLLDADELRQIANQIAAPEQVSSGFATLLEHTARRGSYSGQCFLVGRQRRLHADLVLTALVDDAVDDAADDEDANDRLKPSSPDRHRAGARVSGFLATAVDVSERERATEALRRLNERFELATHSGGMGIWDWDITADTLMWDSRTYEIYGAARSLKPDMEYMLRTVHPEDVMRARHELVEALKSPQLQFRTTFRIICPSGEERVVSASGLTLRNSAGRAVRMTGLIWDVTESQRVERMKNEFVATVSHELRTPLTSIRGSLGLVAAGVAGSLPDRAASLVHMALNNCERLTLLINDILDIEKLESDKQRFDIRTVPVAELVNRSLEDNSGFAQSLGVRFSTPEPLATAPVLVDSSRFLQVMANLLSNASKFSPAGATVEVTAKSSNHRVRVTVRDFGKGIPPEFQSRIFQKFSQADSSDSRRLAGTGLGLAISRAIVERLGGSIGFETSAGGTTFFFELPEAASIGVSPLVIAHPQAT